jgi:hypothetical protein
MSLRHDELETMTELAVSISAIRKAALNWALRLHSGLLG